MWRSVVVVWLNSTLPRRRSFLYPFMFRKWPKSSQNDNAVAVLAPRPEAGAPWARAEDALFEPGELWAEVRALRAEMAARRREDLLAESGLSPAGQAVVRLAADAAGAVPDTDLLAQLIAAQRRVEAEAVERSLVRGIRAVTAADMQTPTERVQSALNWLFGLPSEPLPPPSMCSIRDLYQAITGDVNWYGVFNAEWAQLSANTTTLAGMVTNALNKVVSQHALNRRRCNFAVWSASRIMSPIDRKYSKRRGQREVVYELSSQARAVGSDRPALS